MSAQAVTKTTHPDGYEWYTRAKGDPQRKGDTTFIVEAQEDRIEFYLSEYMGRNRDNYDYDHDAEIALAEDDVRELNLLLTVWLERRS